MTDSEHPNILVSIVIPTLGRNDGLQNAVDSLFALPDAALTRAEIVVVDNSPTMAARPIFDALVQRSSIPMQYISEPSPGVANARNSGLHAAKASLIAFLDDDETARTGWLDGLLEAHAAYDAAVVFGPVETVLPEQTTKHVDYFSRFFARTYDGPDGEMEGYFGCGNSLLDLNKIRDCLPAGMPFFDIAANASGGEDDALFQKVREGGQTFAWTSKSVVDEHAPAKRVRLSYTLRRAFAYGQGPCSTCWRESPPNLPGIAFWMTVGAGQFVIYGLATTALWIMRSSKRAAMMDRAIRGLGKVLWFPPFKLEFYGASATVQTSDVTVAEGQTDEVTPASEIEIENQEVTRVA